MAATGTKNNTKNNTSGKSAGTGKKSSKSSSSTKATTSKGSKAKTTSKSSTSKSKTSGKTEKANNGKNQSDKVVDRHYYEIKIILVFAFAVLSGLSMHTDAVGIFGLLFKKSFLGLFGRFGYFMPYIICTGVFFYINPNFREKRIKNLTAVGVLIVFGMLLNFVVQLADQEIASLGKISDSFNQGVDGVGSGVIGTILGKAVHGLIGSGGIYVVIFALALIFLVLTTSFKVSDLINKLRDMKIDTPKAKRSSANVSSEVVDDITLEDQLQPQGKIKKKTKAAPRYDEQEFLRKMTDDTYYKSPTKSLVGWMNGNAKKQNKIDRYDFDKINHTEENKKLKNVEKQLKDKDVVVANNGSQPELKPELSKEPIVAQEVIQTSEKAPSNPVISSYSTELSEDGLDLVIDPIIIGHDTGVGISKPIDEPDGKVDKLKAAINNTKAEKTSEIGDKDSINDQTSTKDDGCEQQTQAKQKEAVKPLSKSEENSIINEIDKNVKNEYENYKIPSIKLLNKVKNSSNAEDKKNMLERSKLLEDTLKVFGVEAKVIQISRGPAITRYEIQLKPGIKISKIVGLSDDIALNLATQQVRIAPVPGKAAVGIELPNKDTQIVSLREVLESNEFKNGKSTLNVGLGKDIAGASIIADIGKMPHTLVAGATGSGKSVCINTIITSILCNTKPDEVKLLMVDPKMVELNNYNGIPHLILPVVTDPKKASVALNWAVQEMTKRYTQFAESGVRDIDGFNEKFKEEKEKYMPRIVVIVDELADLMMVAPNQVEDAITRLAQMARAAGIHLILATQRPSVDVITGVIKANIPSRIAFAVSSQTDSRTILDMGGAEKLLGKGDMLYYPVGASKPVRVQGAFISDGEVESIVSFIKNQVDNVSYNDEILETTTVVGGNDETADDFLSDAIKLVVDMEQASISMLQRKFRIGYNRAARLIDSMEERGIVGPSQGSKARTVLITKEELDN